MYVGAVAAQGILLGKYYFEVEISGLCAVVGDVTDRAASKVFPGLDTQGVGFADFGSGGLLLQDKFTDFGPLGESTFVSGNPNPRIGVTIDSCAGKIWFSRDGKWMNGNILEEDAELTDENVHLYLSRASNFCMLLLDDSQINTFQKGGICVLVTRGFRCIRIN